MDKQEIIKELEKVIKALKKVEKNTLLFKEILSDLSLDLTQALIEDKDIKSLFDKITTQVDELTQEWSAVDCLNIAYNEIKNRKGRMINGKFIKDEK